MTSKHLSIFVLLASFVVAPAAYADSGDEATITVVDEGATPDDVVKVIELPDRARQNPGAKAVPGSEAASSANGRAAESGQEVSEEARNKDLKDQAKAEANEAKKNDPRNDNAGGKGHGPH